jgi:predicted nucleic acid-binding protein
MKTWVLDCSFAAASFLPDENSELTDKFFSNSGTEFNAVVPSIWWYEINNVILVSKRRKRLTDESIEIIYNSFESFPIEMDKNFSFQTMKSIYEIGKKYDLSVYDSAYLELCKRKIAGLASFDEKLIKAAVKEKISIYK